MHVNDATDLFRHITTEMASLCRAIMHVLAAARRQYRLQLRPDEEGRFSAQPSTRMWPPASSASSRAVSEAASEVRFIAPTFTSPLSWLKLSDLI